MKSPQKISSEIQVIGFDLDQTLYPKSPEIDRSIQQYLYIKIAEHRKVDLAEAERLFEERYQSGRGIGGRTTLLDLGVPNAAELVQEALEKAPIADFLIPDQKTIALLKSLKAKYRSIDILSGSNTANVETKLEHLEIPANLFGHMLTADHGNKASGNLYKQWLALYPDLQPQNFLYIGDRVKSDYEAPKELGIPSILVYVSKNDPAVDCPQLKTFIEIQNLLL